MKVYGVISRDREGMPIAVAMLSDENEALDFRALLKSRGHRSVELSKMSPLKFSAWQLWMSRLWYDENNDEQASTGT